MLALPALVIGWITIEPILFGSYFNEVIYVLPEHDVLRNMAPDFHGSFDFLIHSFSAGLAFYLALAGVLTAWFLYIKKPHIPAIINSKLKFLVNLLEEKYYFDKLWMSVFPKTGKAIGYFLWKQGDEKIIDNGLVNGTASSVRSLSFVMRRLQTGYLYHYAFAMILGLISILTWLLWV